MNLRLSESQAANLRLASLWSLGKCVEPARFFTSEREVNNIAKLRHNIPINVFVVVQTNLFV